MAKQKELTLVTKGTANFNLVGKANVSDFTFKTDVESKKEGSDWIYNQMNLGVDCGQNGLIYGDMMAGYGSRRKNKVFVHGVKENENGKKVDDFKSNFEIDWEDRLDEDNFEVIGEKCFLTVGLEQDSNGKTVYKKFLSAYDAIFYIEEHLEKDMVINVKGNIKYQSYNDTLSAKKEITSIVLSKAEEKDFKATFTQTLLLDSDAIGKVDKETRTVSIDAMVVDFAKEYQETKIVRMVNGKKKEGYNIPLRKTFEFAIGDDTEKAKKMLKFFKSKKVTELTVDGYFTKGDLTTVSISENDIPDDINELIMLGLMDKDEVLGKMAFSNGGKKPEKMVIKSPHLLMKDVNGIKVPSIDRVIDKYTEDDVNPFLIIESLGIVEEEKKEEIKEEEFDFDSIADKDTDSEDDDSWLDNL